MNLKTLTLVVISISIFSCKSSKFITSDDYAKLNLDFKADNISIIDERTFISQEDDIKLPFVSYPTQIYDFHPKLKEEYRDIIINTIRENLDNASQKTSRITVSIIEARKEFSATFSTEQELVAIKLKVVIETNEDKLEVIESGEFYRRSMDATYNKFEKLFRRSLKEVTYKALKKTRKQSVANN